MKKKHFIFILFSLSFFSVFSQTNILHAGIEYYFSIENSINIPTVIKNNDGTITLTHHEQYITDIFAKYEIYDFQLANPETSETRFTISFKSKDLINDLAQNVPLEIFSNIHAYKTSPINQDLITALNGVSFDVLKYISNPDQLACGSCPPYDVPNDFNFSITFNYSLNKDVFYLTSDGVSPCGNEFSIGLIGGNLDNGNNTLQLWEVNSISASASNPSQSCNYIEQILYLILGIHTNGYSYGDFKVSIDPETNHLKLIKDDIIVGYNLIEFSQKKLSTEDEFLKQMNPFQTKENPYLQISGIQNQKINIEIYNITGQKIISSRAFQNNNIDLSNFKKGIYILKLSNTNNQQKVFKFLKT